MLLHLILLLILSTQSHSRSIPRFEDFQVDSSGMCNGFSVKIRFPKPSYLEPQKEARGVAESRKADFAGHYILASGYSDCGAGCIDVVIVDARNGKIYPIPFTIIDCCGPHNSSDDTHGSLKNMEDHSKEPRIEYELGSKLIIIRGARNEKGWGTYYYKWEKNKLKLIRAIEGKIIPTTSPESTHWE